MNKSQKKLLAKKLGKHFQGADEHGIHLDKKFLRYFPSRRQQAEAYIGKILLQHTGKTVNLGLPDATELETAAGYLDSLVVRSAFHVVASAIDTLNNNPEITNQPDGAELLKDIRAFAFELSEELSTITDEDEYTFKAL
jgi:hypothetical protein